MLSKGMHMRRDRDAGTQDRVEYVTAVLSSGSLLHNNTETCNKHIHTVIEEEASARYEPCPAIGDFSILR